MVVTRSQDTAAQQCDEFALVDALLSCNSSRAKVLLSQDASRAAKLGPSGFCCLHAAALVDAHRLVGLLVAAGLSPDAQVEALDGQAAFQLRSFLREHSRGRLPSSKLCAVFRGVTPLHIACWLGHAATVQALLEAGADPEVPCLEGRTALSIACYFLDCRPKKSMAIIHGLLEAGADPLCADFHGIGSLVLSPHCPPGIQHLLLDRVLLRFGGLGAPSSSGSSDASTSSGGGGTGAAQAGSTDGSQEAGPSSSRVTADNEAGSSYVDAAAAGAAAAAAAGAAAVAAAAAAAAGAGAPAAEAAAGDGAAGPPAADLLPGLLLPPEKHVDVLQAALVSKHCAAFDFFLAATSAEVDYPHHAVHRILSLAIVSGDTRLVLRILHSGLRPDAGGTNSQGHPHVAVAAVSKHEAVLDVLCAHGGAVTLRALHHATDTRSLQGLELLLARGRPPVLTSDAPVHIGGAHSRSGELCVMLRLLRDTAFRLRYCYRIDQPRHLSDSLRMVEALADAGYRPTKYPQAIVHNGWIDLQGRVVADYDPTQDRPTAFDLQGVNKYTWLAAKREPWSWQRHKQWPPRFKAAVQTLLLVHHSGRVGASSSGGRLPAGSSASWGGPVTRGQAQKRARLEPTQPQPASAAAAAAANDDEDTSGGKARRKQPQPQPQRPSAKRGRGLVGAPTGKPAAGVAQGRQAGPAAAALRPALACLPPELLMHIVGLASYPISAWV